MEAGRRMTYGEWCRLQGLKQNAETFRLWLLWLCFNAL